MSPAIAFGFPILLLSIVGNIRSQDWHIAANANIEANRKTDLNLSVAAGGKQSSGAELRVEQVKHDYRFGVGVDRKELGNAKYWDIVRQNYNYTVETNALKWRNWDRSTALASHAKAAAAGLPMRGHCIFWGRDKMDNISASGTELRNKMQARVKEAVGTFKGKITEWDFNNEIINNQGGLADYYSKTLGPDIINDIFAWTHAIDPNIMMYFNEFGCEGEKMKAPHYYKLVKGYLDKGLPKDKMGIGLQSHMSDNGGLGENLTPEYLYRCLNTLAPLGLPILATEFDYDNPDDRKRADGLEMFYRIFFSHPATNGIIQWGFWDQRNWKPASALWKGSGFTETDVAKRYRQLVFQEWWTRETLKTDGEGQAVARIFYGTHRITVTHGGKTAVFTLTYPRGGKPVLDKAQDGDLRLTAAAKGSPVALRHSSLESSGPIRPRVRLAGEGALPVWMIDQSAVDGLGRLRPLRSGAPIQRTVSGRPQRAAIDQSGLGR